jgi:hypothetical protein
MEERKDIPWYEWLYQASTEGRIKSLERYQQNHSKRQKVESRILVQLKSSSWYYWVNLSKQWKAKMTQVHRLVIKTFVWESDLDVNHKDLNKLNNSLENLEYCTKSENMRHAIKNWVMIWKWDISWVKNWKARRTWQYDLDWNLIKVWWYAKEATKYVNITLSTITACCRWEIKTGLWYIRKYL